MVTTRSAAQKSADAAEMVSENDPSQNGHLDGCNINKEDIKYVSICMNIFLLFLSDSINSQMVQLHLYSFIINDYGLYLVNNLVCIRTGY